MWEKLPPFHFKPTRYASRLSVLRDDDYMIAVIPGTNRIIPLWQMFRGIFISLWCKC